MALPTVDVPDEFVDWQSLSRPAIYGQIEEDRARDSATAQLETLPASAWVRKRWLDVARQASESAWSNLPDDIMDVVARGASLTLRDLEVFARLSQSSEVNSAVAATRLLGLWAEDNPYAVSLLKPVLEKALKHEYGRVRAVAAEALWCAGSAASADTIREAAADEAIPSVKETMLHLAGLLAKPL